jgi:hypothetical protein
MQLVKKPHRLVELDGCELEVPMSCFIDDPVIYRCRLLSRKLRDVDPFVAVGARDLNPAMGISRHRCI